MVSIKTKYALAVVLQLALQTTGDLLTIKDLAEKCQVPKKYLEQILNTLRKCGIVQSVRGPQGGVKLAKSPTQITVYDIAWNLEQQLLLAQGYTGGLVLEDCWKTIDLKLKSSFNITIDSLVKKQHKANEVLTFAI